MAEKKAPAAKLTLRNTKQEMLDAYHDTLKQLQEKRQLELQPQERVEEKEK